MLFLYIAAAIFFLDRISKTVLIKNLFPDESIAVIDKVFSITYVKNTGSAFGLFPNATGFFILISIIAIAVITVLLIRLKKEDFLIKLALALVMGGAAGNLFDRLMFGYVIDFLDFKIWPVFNLADSLITVGCGLLFFKIFIPGRRNHDKE
ncbi:MAG: signal peptidase II [Candidatus Omnitrophota bacterium]